MKCDNSFRTRLASSFSLSLSLKQKNIEKNTVRAAYCEPPGGQESVHNRDTSY